MGKRGGTDTSRQLEGVLPKEEAPIFPNPFPRENVKISGSLFNPSYVKNKIEMTTYTFPDRDLKISIPRYLENEKDLLLTPKEALALYDELPKVVQDTTRAIALYDFHPTLENVIHPRDIFVAGYGSSFEVSLFNKWSGARYPKEGVFFHEACHTIDLRTEIMGERVRPAGCHDFSDAKESDRKLTGKAAVTSYGATSYIEDFAETGALYLLDPESFRVDFPARAEFFDRLFKEGPSILPKYQEGSLFG